MRIVFMGTPEFAARALERLYSDGHDVIGIFTKPDKPKNRGMKLQPSPVKELALNHGTPVFQPQTLKDGTAEKELRTLNPELIAVVAYGKLLPKEILALPPLGCVNIHGSILPKYRGSAPIQWAVLNGEKTTGVTSQYMAEAMDAGDIILMKKTDIGENETSGELYDRMSMLGAELLGETVAAIAAEKAARTPQDDADATFAPPLTKELSPIDWTKTALEISCLIRGLNPWPLATADIRGTSFRIYSAETKTGKTDKPAGTMLSAGKDGIEIACAGGSVIIKELQAPGGKRMAAADYLRGHPICL